MEAEADLRLRFQEFKVPEGFPEILRDFTREVLREQPKDINKYGRTSSPPRISQRWDQFKLSCAPHQATITS